MIQDILPKQFKLKYKTTKPDADDSTDIRCDEEELATAEWLSRSDIPEANNTASLTWTMIEAFRNGEI